MVRNRIQNLTWLLSALLLGACSVDFSAKDSASPFGNGPDPDVSTNFKPVSVLVGNGGVRAHTLDGGKNWQGEWDSQGADACWSYRDLGYGNGMWVAISKTAAFSRVSTSPNGVHWRHAENVISSSTVAYGNGMFVTDGYISLDGYTFTPRAQPGLSVVGTNPGLRYVPSNRGFIAFGDNGGMAFSADGVTFTQTLAPPANPNSRIMRIAISNSAMIAITPTKIVRSQSGGTTVSPTEPLSSNPYNPTLGQEPYLINVFFNGQVFILTGKNHSYSSNNAGYSWVTLPTPPPPFAFVAGTPLFGFVAQMLSGGLIDPANLGYSMDAVSYQPAEAISFSPSVVGSTLPLSTTGIITGLPSEDPNGPPPASMPPSILLGKSELIGASCSVPFDRQ